MIIMCFIFIDNNVFYFYFKSNLKCINLDKSLRIINNIHVVSCLFDYTAVVMSGKVDTL